VKYCPIRDKSVLIIRSVVEDFFRDFVPYKKCILKKLVGELDTTVRLQKQRLQPASV